MVTWRRYGLRAKTSESSPRRLEHDSTRPAITNLRLYSKSLYVIVLLQNLVKYRQVALARSPHGDFRLILCYIVVTSFTDIS